MRTGNTGIDFSTGAPAETGRPKTRARQIHPIASRFDRLNMRLIAAKQGRASDGRMMGLLQRLFGRPDRGTAPALYAAIVARGRDAHWYEAGAVPDSVDGRFDMIAAVMALVLLRLEGDPEGVPLSALVAECFIEDMDGQLREIGIGDVVVGKHMGRMMGMLGGRIGAYRAGLAGGDLKPALVRNLYRGHTPEDPALAHVETNLLALHESLAKAPLAALLSGDLPE